MGEVGFITDPIDRFDLEAETTLFLMKEAKRRRYGIVVCEPHEITLKGPEPWAVMREIELLWPVRKDPFYHIKARRTVRLATLTLLFLRKDPPFDLAYLHHLYILAPLRGRVPMVNDPIGIMEANEKLFALQFGRWTPETVVTASEDDILAFVRSHGHGAVVKPLNSGGGVGVVWLRENDPDLRQQIGTATDLGRRAVLCQEFLPAVSKGDKRILLMDGVPLGAFLRLARPGEFRANLHQGGSFHAATTTRRERRMLEEMAPLLLAKGLRFVGLDVIGGKLTEVNVTSPMGIRELNATGRGRAERRVFDCL